MNDENNSASSADEILKDAEYLDGQPTSLASEIWTWQEGNRLYSRFTTNVSTPTFIARLVAFELLELVETIHAYFGDRAEGGCGYEVLWKKQVQWHHLNKLEWL